MNPMDELLSAKRKALKSQFVELLLKEELITEPVYYKALELIKEGDENGNTK